MGDRISDFVVIPDDAPQNFKARLGLKPSETPRVAFIEGPGDAAGTFDHWMEGRFDPRTPVVAYSTMFYTLIDKLQAIALVIAEPEKLPRHRDPRFRFVSIPRARPNGSFSYRQASIAFSRKVIRELRKYEPHVVLLGMDTPWWLMRSIPKSTRVVLTAHNNFWPMGLKSGSLKERLKRQMTSVLMQRVSSGVCTSEETRRQVIELRHLDTGLYAETPQVLSNLPAVLRRSERLRKILFLGHLHEEKGVFDLLSAFENVASQCPDITLAFAGKGEVEDELRRRVAVSTVGDRISMLGQLDSDAVCRELERTDILVYPTRSAFRDGLALVIVEAAVHGVPSVLSSVVSTKELVANASLEFPADDIQALAATLVMLATETETLHKLQNMVAKDRQKFFDRSRSWGSQLYHAFVA